MRLSSACVKCAGAMRNIELDLHGSKFMRSIAFSRARASMISPGGSAAAVQLAVDSGAISFHCGRSSR